VAKSLQATRDKNLPPGIPKFVEGRRVIADEANLSSARFDRLATLAENYKFKWYTAEAGVGVTIQEFLKSTAPKSLGGGADEITEIRKEIAKLNLDEILKYLKTPVSDKDIALAKSVGVKVEGDASKLPSLLRGYSKMKKLEAQIENIRVEWIYENRGTGKAKSEFRIGQDTVTPGESFDSFVQMKIEKMIREMPDYAPETGKK